MFTVYLPEYYQHFHCLQDKCKHNCCQGWRVSLKKTCYQRLRALKGDKHLEELVAQSVKRSKEENAPDYANITQGKDHLCPFLDEQGLCQLQKRYGHEVLPLICQNFPRNALSIQTLKIAKRACTPACEGVVQLLLEEQEGLGFIAQEEPDSRFANQGIHIHSETANSYIEEFWSIQVRLIDILQNRAYTMDDRMILLGLAMQNFGERPLDEWFRQTHPMAHGGDCAPMLQDLPRQPWVGAGNPLQVVRLLQGPDTRELYQPLLERFLEDSDIPDSFQVLMNNYQQAKTDFETHCPQGQVLLENLMVNHVFQGMMPLTPEGPWAEYQFMVCLYTMLRFLCYGHFTPQGSAQDLVCPISDFCRTLIHSAGVKKTLLTMLENTQSNSLAHMVLLLKG